MLRNLCRLCMIVTNDGAKNIFEKSDNESAPLASRLSALFGIEYDTNTEYPQKICSVCFDTVEQFTSFIRLGHYCESEIAIRCQNFLGMDADEPVPGLNGCEGTFQVTADMEIVTLDPYEEVESSDEDFSMDEDSNGSGTDQQSASNKETAPLVEQHPATNEVQEADAKTAADSQSSDLTSKTAYLCPICDRAFTLQSECIDHEAAHNRGAPYTCTFCIFSCVERSLLISHIKELHDPDRPYICMQCKKRFCRRSDLKKHTVVHTGVRPYTCTTCSKSFSRNTNLTKHMRIHSSDKPHVCQYCPRSFSTTLELSRHAALHAGAKAFQCTHCPLSFARKDKLQQHELAQHGDAAKTTSLEGEQRVNAATTSSKTQQRPSKHCREHNCRICGKSFMRERDLQRHKALHLDSLFSCKQCGSGFSRCEKLLKHEQEVHGAQFKCHDCPSVFLNKILLDEHVKIHITPQQNTAESTASTLPEHVVSNTSQPLSKDFLFYGSVMPNMALGFYSEQTGDT